MRQRESIALPQVPVYSRHGKLTLTTLVAKYMLDKGYTDLPLLFLDSHGVFGAIRDAKLYADKIDKSAPDADVFQHMPLQETTICTPQEANTLEQAVGDFILDTMTDTAACILTFESGNSVALVGSSGNYYVIDVANNLFFTINSPEYVITEYCEEYGGTGAFKAHILAPKQAVEPEEEVSVVVEEEEAKEPKIKKPRTTVRRKKKAEPKEKEEVDEPASVLLEEGISLVQEELRQAELVAE